MVGFKSAKGSGLEWLPTGIQTGFSNFRFIDERFHSSPVLRRLFSLARKLGYESLVIEENISMRLPVSSPRLTAGGSNDSRPLPMRTYLFCGRY